MDVAAHPLEHWKREVVADTVYIQTEKAQEEMDQATQITENIYLGSLAVARDLPALQRLQISAIVCAAAEARPHFPDEFDYFEMTDLVEHACDIDDIVKALDDIWTFVSAQLLAQDKKVLVHCVHGRTRSASIVTYILAKQSCCSIREAYALIASKRDVLVPEAWLEALEAKLCQSKNKPGPDISMKL